MSSGAQIKRLRWLCTHRALREMDVLLGNFLERHLSNLNAEQEAAFVILAEMEDIELWPLVTGRRECPDPIQNQILSMLRDAGSPTRNPVDP
jgi:succinate dehydrogenase flavin-adding protein (antitoxin of CptAB toxin-antitoxin module)